jgi:hypothetical protein
LVEGPLETVEDQVEPELEVLLATRPHDLGDDLDDVDSSARSWPRTSADTCCVSSTWNGRLSCWRVNP